MAPYFTLENVVDGNAFSIISYVRSAMKSAKMSGRDIDEYTTDATSADYNHLLIISCEMLERVNEMIEPMYDEDEEDEDY